MEGPFRRIILAKFSSFVCLVAILSELQARCDFCLPLLEVQLHPALRTYKNGGRTLHKHRPDG
jgi:hypothetical protein